MSINITETLVIWNNITKLL